MAKVSIKPLTVDKQNPQRGLQQLEDAYNTLARELNHVLTNLDNSNLTEAFSKKIGGS